MTTRRELDQSTPRGSGGSLTPDDLIAVAEHASRTLAPALGKDWSVRAGALEWDVRATLEHAAGAMVWYAAHLASQTRSFLGLQARAREQADSERVLNLVPAAARLLAHVAAGSPDDARAQHLSGMADPTGFLALGCEETMVHAWDAANGLQLDYEPAAELAEKVVRRLFPWAPEETEPFTTLLWATGRASLPGHDDVTEQWGMHPAPLAEWDGTVPSGMIVGLRFEWDAATERWLPAGAR